MKNKSIVITGGPGTGKSSVVQKLEEKGFTCMHEVSREIIIEAQKQGIEQLFLEDPILFSQKLLEAREKQHQQIDDFADHTIFLDRGIPDVVAYMDYLGTEYPDHFRKSCEAHKYDKIFILPPWKDIHVTDKERYESFEQALEIHEQLQNTYIQYGYRVIEVPKTTVEKRAEFILNHLDD